MEMAELGPESPYFAGRVRKRIDSEASTTVESISVVKRLRMDRPMGSPISSSSNLRDLPNPPISSLDQSMMNMLNTVPPRIEVDPEEVRRRVRARSLSRRSSMTSASPTPPSPNPLDSFAYRARIGTNNPDVVHSLLRRSVSAASFASYSSPATQEVTYEEESARTHMRNPKFVVDFVTPTPAAPVIPPPPPPPQPVIIRGLPPLDPQGPPPPVHITDPRLLIPPVNPNVLSCSISNTLFFTRGNRLYYKNLAANDEVGQMCKLKEQHGTYTAITCGDEENSNTLAAATSKGYIVVYNVQTKQRVEGWTTQPVTALAWNSKTLTVGYASGKIRHFDTSITPKEKMKEQVLLLTRHQSAITRLEWNADKTLLASGDKKGNVYCWKKKQKVPLEVGDYYDQRRKKIKHEGAVSAIAWSPWQWKVLLTADIRGVIQFWRIDHEIKASNALTPAKLDTGAAITGIQWSKQCKEFLTTHGYKRPPPIDPSSASDTPSIPLLRHQPPSQNIENTLSVWQFPSLRFVTSKKMDTTDLPLGNSVPFMHTQKIAFTVPEDGKIHCCEVWGKRKPNPKLKRQSSLDYAGLIR